MNSVLVQNYGFMRAYEYYSLYLVGFVILYFVFCGHFLMFGAPCGLAEGAKYIKEENMELIKDPNSRIKVYA